MPGAPIHTWRDLLLPNEQDTHVSLYEVTEGQNTAKTSSFSLPTWDAERLPPSARLFEDLPSKMHEHLAVIIDQHFSDQAARTSSTNRIGYSVTPNSVIEDFRGHLSNCAFSLSHEARTGSITGYLAYLVNIVYAALTGNFLNRQRRQERTSDGAVITDHIFQFNDGIKILWADKSSRAFDSFIGEMMKQMRGRSAVELCTESVATTYRGYNLQGHLGRRHLSKSYL